MNDLKLNSVDAVLVSVTRYDLTTQSSINRVVREFPRVPTVALLSEVERNTPQAVLQLGQTGVKQLVDVREPAGWRELRTVLLSSRGEDIQRQALSQLAVDLAGACEECWQFFEALYLASPRVSTVRTLSHMLGALPSTLMSRFFRAGLPAPKRYIAMARLVRAARLFENPGFSIANVANHLDYSSPQSFGRHVRTLIGLTAVEFRDQYDGEKMLQQFRAELVLPYLSTLRDFRPLALSSQEWPRRRRVH